MKLIKLGQKGIAHTVLPLAVIVVLAVAGTAYLVSTHAQTPPTAVGSAANVGSCKSRQFASGDVGNCVKYIQRMSNGYNKYFKVPATITPGAVNLTVDGNFGSLTKGQVIRWQKYEKISADGIVGPVTWGKLCYMADQIWSINPLPAGTSDAETAAGQAGCSVHAI